MSDLQEYGLRCPYCDEAITVLLDESVARQAYVEDCEVCCRPILLDVTVARDGATEVLASAENE